jgi:hypothetical protein
MTGTAPQPVFFSLKDQNVIGVPVMLAGNVQGWRFFVINSHGGASEITLPSSVTGSSSY